MTTDDYLLDQVDRSQQLRTRRRRDERSRRKHFWLLGGFAAVAMLVLCAPSFVSHSSLGRSMLTRTLGDYGLQGSSESVRMGWVTPLQVTGLSIEGQEGSKLHADQIDMDLTVMDLIRGSNMGGNDSNLGQIALRGLDVQCSIRDGRCSLEDDLEQILNTPSGGKSATGTIKVQDITVTIVDAMTGEQWRVAQSNADVEMAADNVAATFAGVLTEPSGSGGSFGGVIQMKTSGSSAYALPGKESLWRLELRSESLPLSVVSLLRRRMSDLAATIPPNIGGDATGEIVIAKSVDGSMEASVRQLQVRDLRASGFQSDSDSTLAVWKNSLATLDGDLLLVNDRVIGRGLEATTDFAKATMNGAFARSFSLVGANDNPVRWLEAIDGTATAEVDLAALDRSLPGILPIRSDAELISGRIVGQVDSTPGTDSRLSKLRLRSDSIRARAHGRAVVIDPIEMNATVSSDHGYVHADNFQWTSTFGSAIGRGDARSGSADFEIDFGRFTAMLRPIIEISETSLAGSAQGKIRWNASEDSVWKLSGNADATNLLVTFPSGQSLRRQSLRGQIEAVGRWGGRSLEELTKADVSLASNGLDIRAELVQSVVSPNAQVPLPLRIQGNGRLETLAEILGPWMPSDLQESSGGFDLHARAAVSTVSARLASATVEMTQPRLTYAQRNFRQPVVKLQFEGDYAWPSGDLHAQNLTLAGDAFSAAAQGEMTAEKTDIEIRWRAKLDRLQGSVENRIASLRSIQQVGYQPGSQGSQPTETEQWLVTGDCEGDFIITSDQGRLQISSDMIGKDLAIVQPVESSAAFQTVGPIRSAGPNADSTVGSHTVWSEPNLKLNGTVRVEMQTGTVLADNVQVAGDWFASTLSGKVIWNEEIGDVRLEGPARLKMDEVAERLSPLAGTRIVAEGIHETPLKIEATRGADGNLAFDILANLGWDLGEVAGVAFGAAKVPVRWTETSVEIARSRVPVGQGAMNLGGKVHYRPGPMWMQIDPGLIAESIELTPEMTDRWLKYLAPLAAGAARIDGVVSAELDETMVIFDHPEQSRVVGRLNIEGVRMNAGPMANQVILGVDQLKSLAGMLSRPAGSRTDQTLITMPPQTVDFAVDRGVVIHERLYFDIDRAQLVTSGQVALDGRLNLVAQVPLDASWLGESLKGMAGQTVTLPIDGTLSRPRLDSSGVKQMVARLGSQAIQSTAENYLQKQLNKGIERIGLEKIFGKPK